MTRASHHRFFKPIIVLVICVFCFFTPARSQQILDNGTSKLYGNILAEPTKKPLAGVSVGLYKGVIKIKQTTTDKSGKFMLEIGSNTGEYKMVFSCPAYLTMYCTVNTNIPENKLPYNGGFEFVGLPMWPANTTVINVYAYKESPFSKIYWQSNKLDADVKHMAWFSKKLLDLAEMQTKKEQEENEKIAKEKEKLEKEKQEKLKKEQELQAKLEKEKKEKELAELEKLKKEQEEQARLKKEQEEKEKQQQEVVVDNSNNDQSLENDQIKIKTEKEKMEQQKKNNQKVKTEYESEMLKIVAENEKKEKEKQYFKEKDSAETNSMIERMKREQELKNKLNKLKMEIAALEKNQNVNIYNGQKQQQMKTLIETTAQIEKQLKEIQTSNANTSPSQFKVKPIPKVEVVTTNYTFSTETITTITDGNVKTIYKKVDYGWWGVDYYKNDVEIDESTYVKEIAKYKTGQ